VTDDDDDLFVAVCTPISYGPASIPGSTLHSCQKCSELCHVSPSSVNRAKRAGKRFEVLCLDCYRKKPMPDKIIEQDDEQRAELRRALGLEPNSNEEDESR